MQRCPGCNAVIDGDVLRSGKCPACGHDLAPRTIAYETTLGQTAEFKSPEEVSDVKPVESLEPTRDAADLAPPMPGQPQRIVTAATRKLSVKDLTNLTQSWESLIPPNADARTSIKSGSGTVSGMGSSLVVKPRALRDARETDATGADYELLEVIGKGGMGVVYSARQASVDRMVAVKMIKPTAATDPERREKFLSEAVVTGDLDHPNIVPIYELGTNEQDALFYSMKRVEGTPWSKVIRKKSLADNLEILLKVADAVAFAHANGVVHRDLKPENVMLGGFGEVLVMDWGLALATSSFRHTGFVTGPDNMGGTPGYMAPEMVTGPFETIGPASDIYLLGAMLYEIVTGKLPHRGNTTMECLYAAARNEIQPTDKSGELLDIAYRAMSTYPADRYGSVQEFQAAIREYQSHSDAIALAERAEQELSVARESNDYQDYARALFGFQEALVLWESNTRAQAGVVAAKLAYAQRARQQGDYELGISLLDPQEPSHGELRAELERLQRERAARQKWLSRFKHIAAALAVSIFIIIFVSFLMVSDQRNKALAAKKDAEDARDDARRSEKKARVEEARAKREESRALKAEGKAREEETRARREERRARVAEKRAREEEENAKREEKRARIAESQARQAEAEAVVAREREEYEAYVTRVGMAAAKVEEGAFDTADQLLLDCKPAELRHWEWGRLKHLCSQGVAFRGSGTINEVAFIPGSNRFVVAANMHFVGAGGRAQIWDPSSRKPQTVIEYDAGLQSLAVSPDGQFLAAGDIDGSVAIHRIDDGSLVRKWRAHSKPVLSITFSPQEGRWLVTSSADNRVKIWDPASGREAHAPLLGHNWWVWSAAFSPDASMLATAGQDGKVILWSISAESNLHFAQAGVFLGHDGPVFTVAFSPNGDWIASAGHDERVLVWKPAELREVDLKLLAANEPMTPQPARSFEGHSAPIRDLDFSADGDYLLSAGDDNSIRIWSVMTGKVRSTLRGHSRPVQSCAFSADGRYVVSGAQEGQIKLWSILNYEEVRVMQGHVLQGHSDAILSARFSPDGRQVITASRDRSARSYDTTTGKPLQAFVEGHDFLASKGIFFFDGKRLLTAAGDNSVRIWDAFTGAQLSSLEGTGHASTVAVSNDSQWILTGNRETGPDAANSDSGEQGPADRSQLRRLRLYEVQLDGRTRRLELPSPSFGTGHQVTVTTVAISPDRKWLFSGDQAGVGKLWNAETGEEAATLRGHRQGISEAVFLPDGQRLLTASYDGSVGQWEVPSGKGLPLVLSHRREPVTAMAVSPRGRLVLTATTDLPSKQPGATAERPPARSVVRLWDADQAKLLNVLYDGPEIVTSVAFSPVDETALSVSASSRPSAGASGDALIRQWDLTSGREITSRDDQPLLVFPREGDRVWSAAFAPDARLVLTVGSNGARLWDPLRPDQPEVSFVPHGTVTSADFSPDDKEVITGSIDRTAKVWDAESGRMLFRLPLEHTGPVHLALFSPVDATIALTGSSDGSVRIWNLEARETLHTIQHSGPVRAARFSPGGARVASACDGETTIHIWDAGTGDETMALENESPVRAIAFSADEDLLITGGSDGIARIFDLATGERVARLQGHSAAINSVAFSRDGRRALTGSDDQSVKVWDVSQGIPRGERADNEPNQPPVRNSKEVLTLKHHSQPVTAVAFSPDDRHVLSAGLDGTSVLWLADDWIEPLLNEQ